MNGWRLAEPDTALYRGLMKELDISEPLARLLVNREITSAEEARAFFDDGLEQLTSPWLLSGIEKAVQRIEEAVKRGERIIIYGDYDVDGVCSVALMMECFARLGVRADYYVPNRFSEGYGLNAAAVRKLAAMGYTLMITVDCGINAVQELALARRLGLDVIVSDHHQLTVEEWPAAAVINPHRDQIAAVRELSGAGVAFKLAQALLEHGGKTLPPDMFMELLALATVADVVPLRHENRIMAREGLKYLAETTRPGLRALLRECNLEHKELRSRDIAFQLAPRLNSAGRMQKAGLSVRLLLERDEATAAEIARRLCKLNEERRRVQEDIFEQAREQWEQRSDTDSPVLVLDNADWHEGVSGIVASMLCQRYRKPAVVIVWDGEWGRGSARSVSGVNIFLALERCGEYLDAYGGHALAAGLRLRRDKLEGFRQTLREQVEQCGLSGEQRLALVDLELREEQLVPELARDIKALEPFGMSNPEPLLLLRDIELIRGQWLGAEQQHFKAVMAGSGIEVIAFGFRDKGWEWSEDGPYDILARLEERTWRDQTSLQLRAAAITAADR